jgi:hypothetical protein
MYLALYNPILLIMVVINGCNDGLVAAMFIFGIIAYQKQNFNSSALWISLSIAYKFIPLFVLPVLFVPNRKLNFKFIIPIVSLLLIIFGLSYFWWGMEVLGPILNNAERESKILSIFRYFRGEYSILSFFGTGDIDYLSPPLVITSVIVVFIYAYLKKIIWVKAAIATVIAVYIFFLVGHFQFYLILCGLVFFYLAFYAEKISILNQKRLYLFIIWIYSLMLLYGVTEGFYRHFYVIREFISVPHVMVMLYCMFLVFLKTNTKEIEQSIFPNQRPF